MQFIHDVISWLKARLKGEKVSFKITRLENRFAAVLRNVDTNAQKNNTTNDGDVQYSNYWYPQMSKTDLEYVKRRAKYELDTTENYIDNITKWLYNVKNGNTYFVLYSTEDANEPTILYACKANRAKNEQAWFVRFIEELRSIDNGNYEQSTSVLNQMLETFWNEYKSNNRHSGNGLGRGSNNRNVRATNQKTNFKPSEALFNCLRNIAKISDTDGADLNKGSAFSMPENDDEVSYSFEITPEQDAEYLEAVNNGDMETAQRMVDEAAKDAGYTIKAYHGTTADFNTFDKNKIGQGYTLFASQGFGFYFTESEAVANNSYGKGQRVVGAYLKIKNPFVFIDKNNQKANALLDEFGKKYGRNIDVKDYDVFVDFEKRTGAILSRVVKDKGREFTKFFGRKRI